MENYKKGEILGQGTFGVVFLATQISTGKQVAIKKIRMGDAKGGVEFTALREIKLLREFSSPHVCALLDVFVYRSNVHLVFEYMVSDLEVLVQDKKVLFTPSHIKTMLQSILQGVADLHDAFILHRDMKPGNVLISENRSLKLGDFGLARQYGSPNRPFTHRVVTLWYRAPELLYGAKFYGTGVDIWACGCIFAELLLRKPFLTGESDLDQLARIFYVVGTPQSGGDEELGKRSPRLWPDVSSLPDYVEFEACDPSKDMRDRLSAYGTEACDLLWWMLTLDPKRRPTAREALKHPYFSTGVEASALSDLPLPRKLEDQLAEEKKAAAKKRRRMNGKNSGAKRLAF